MADFDAGSIEGSLELNTDPFVAGLEYARAQAAEFEDNDIIANVRTNYESTGAPAEDAGDTTSKVKLDDAGFKAEVEKDKIKLDELGAKTARPSVDLDNRGFLAGLSSIAQRLALISGGDDDKSRGESGAGGGHGLLYLIGLAASLAPALGPAIAAMGLFGAAGVAGLGAAAGSLALYGAVVKGAVDNLNAAIKAGKQLPGMAGVAETALKGLEGGWKSLQAAVDPGVYRVLADTFNVVAGVLPKLAPLINAISAALDPVIGKFGQLLNSPLFSKFMATLTHLARTDLPLLGGAIVHALGGAMALFDALSPVITMVARSIASVAREFEQWSKSKAGGVITQTLKDIDTYARPLQTLFHGLLDLIGHLVSGLAPLTGPALTFLNALVKALNDINIAPLAKGIGSLLTALSPLLPVLGQILNVLLPPLAKLLGTLANDFITPLAKSLGDNLNPLLHALSGILSALAEPLGEFLASIANLVNPTGVGLLTSLLQGFESIVKTLAGPVGKLAVALESMVDDGIAAIAPAIRPTMGVLNAFAKAIAPVISALAWLLSHKAVADTVLAIGLAFEAFKIGSTVVTGIMGLVNGIRLMIGLAQVAGIMDTLSIAFTGLGASELLALWPIAAIVAGIALLVVAAVELVKHWGAVKDFFGKLWDKIEAGAKAVWTYIKGHWPELLGILTGPFGLAAGEIVKHWDTVKTFFEHLPGDIKSIFSSAASWLVSHGKDILDGLKNGAVAGWDKVTEWLRARKAAVQGFFSNAINWLVSAGSDVLQGLWNGLVSKWNSISSWMKEKADSVPGIFKKAWGILSPSRVFHSIGGFLMQGLHNGLQTAFRGTVLPGVLDVAKSLTGAFDGLGANLGVAGGGTLRVTGTQTLASNVAELTRSVAALSSAHKATQETLATIPTAVADATARATTDHTVAVTQAFQAATDRQTQAIITASRK